MCMLTKNISSVWNFLRGNTVSSIAWYDQPAAKI